MIVARSGVRLLSCLLALACGACGPKQKPAAPPPAEVEEAPPSATVAPGASPAAPRQAAAPKPKPAAPKATPLPRVPVSTQAPPAELWKQFSGDRAWRTVKQLVEFGPRPAGSLELGRARGMLASALGSAAWEVEQQTFTASTPAGDLAGVNLIARFSADGARPVPRTARPIVIGAHYDTRRFSTIRFAGANDGGSGPAVLVEAARVIALDPALAAKVELVLFDAGEPRSQFTPDDGIAGSRHYAKAGMPRRAAILHGVGDASGVLTLPPDSPIDLLSELRAAIAALHSPLQPRIAAVKLWGDHLPLGPGALLLGNHETVSRYTADDTIERVNAETLGHAGQLVVWLAKRWAAGAK